MTGVDNVADSVDSVLSSVTSYAETHSDGINALLLLTGVVIAFSGRTLLRPTVFLLGFAPTSLAVMAFGIAVVADQTRDTAIAKYAFIFEIIVVLFALALGVLVGIVMVRLLFRVATFMLCGGFGAVVVLIVYMLLLQPATSSNALLVWYAAMVLAGLISALVSVGYPETAVILGTAFDGAALAVFSVAGFLGHRPDLLVSPLPLTDDGTSTAPTSLDHWWSIAYAVATIMLALFGAMAQRRVAMADHIIARAEKQREATAAPLLLSAGGQPFDAVDVTDETGDGGQTFGGHRPRSRYLMSGVDEHKQLVTVIEPPRSPAYRRSGSQSPTTGAYGATDSQDAQYSVVQNLGAEPLVPSVEPYYEKNARGPL